MERRTVLYSNLTKARHIPPSLVESDAVRPPVLGNGDRWSSSSSLPGRFAATANYFQARVSTSTSRAPAEILCESLSTADPRPNFKMFIEKRSESSAPNSRAL